MWFKRKKNYGIARITPHLSLIDGNTPLEIRETISKISRKLAECEEIMCNYSRKKTLPYGYVRIANISADYDTYNNKINVSGSLGLSWSGTVEQFLNDEFDHNPIYPQAFPPNFSTVLAIP